MEYFQEKGTFRNLPHCGRKSDLELVELCEELEQAAGAEVEQPKICSVEIMEELSPSELETINRYIENETKTLSQRSSNAIAKYLKNEIDLKNLCEKVYSNSDFQVMNLQNVGKGTVEELASFFDNIESFVSSVCEQKG